MAKNATQESKLKKALGSKVFIYIYLAILSITFFKVYSQSFDKKLNLGGDNAGYYILGQAISMGKGQTNIHYLNPTPSNHFPPGYPIILGGYMKLFSKKIESIKRLNGFFFLMSIFMLFLVVYQITGNTHLAFLSSLFTLLNYHLISYSVIMMSEIPFLFFSLLSVWLMLKVNYNKPLQKNYLFWLFIIAISFTYHIRTTGVALLGAAILYLLINKYWKHCIALVGGFILIAIPNYVRSQNLGGGVYMKKLFDINPYRPELGKMQFADWFSRFWENLERYITREIPSGVSNSVNVLDYKAPIESSEWFIGLIIVAFAAIGLFTLKKHKLLMIFYVLATFGILLLWPPVWNGVRFFIPLIPLFTFFIVYSVFVILNFLSERLLKKQNEAGVVVLMLVLCLVSIGGYSRESLDMLEQQAKGRFAGKYSNYFQLAQWANKNTPDTSVICCRKPQLFYVYAHRYITGFASTTNAEELIEGLKKSSTDYVVLDQLGYSSTSLYLYPAIQKHPEKFKLVQHLKEPDTYLFRFMPDIGYTGSWNDGKREGFGKYCWENGNRFEGNWSNNQRNGEGTLYFPDGTYIKGIWTNDVLNGTVTQYSASGNVIGTQTYANNIVSK